MTISHAAERIYTQGSVAFCPFLGVPKIENYMGATPKSSQVSRFFRGRVKKSKNTIPEYKWPENIFFATKFYPYFSGNPPNVGLSSIFPVSKTHEKMMKIAIFELLHGPFVYLGWVVGRVPKILQNGPETRSNPTSNEQKKT